MTKPSDEKDPVPVLQAVLLADSFNSRFAPVTRTLPRALLPLAGIPLIDYPLKSLADAKVQECIVYCRSHSEAIAKHLATSAQAKRFPTPPIIRQCPANISSLGDVMRDLDQSHLVKNDFILAPADLVTNADLADLLVEHKKRRTKDANSLLTLIMRSTIGGSSTSSLMNAHEQAYIAVTNAETGCLRLLSRAAEKVKLDKTALMSSGRSRLWTGIIDLGLAVCSVHVPPRFTDEFDYRSLEDLVRGVLEHEEILGHTVALQVLGSREYACRVSNMRLYALATKHLLDNWVFPVTPASMSGTRTSNDYQIRPRNVYVSSKANVHRSSRLTKSVLVGPGAKVGSNCSLVNCVIGANCFIGNGCSLSDCYLWPGAIVGNDCHIQQSLLCGNSQVLNGSTLTDRCVLTPGVKVGPEAELCDCRLIVRSDGEKPASGFGGKQRPGKESNAALYRSAARGDSGVSGSDTDEQDSDEIDYGRDDGKNCQTGDKPDEPEEEIWQFNYRRNTDDEISSSESEDSSDDANEVPTADVGEDHFSRELLDVLQRAEHDNHGVDTMVVEINSIKHAFCVHIDRLKGILVRTILEYPILRREKDLEDKFEDASATNLSPTDYVREAEQLLASWTPLLKHYFNAFASTEESLVFLRGFEDACCDRPVPLMQCTLRLLRYFYDKDLCDEPAILRWHAEDGSHQRAGELRDKVSRMIQWLKEASEESDD